MTVSAPTSLQTDDFLTRAVNRDDVDKDEWLSTVGENQHHGYKYIRPNIISENYEYNPFTTTGTSYTIIMQIPTDGALWLPDDFDATVELGVKVRATYTGANDGNVLVRFYDGSTTDNVLFTFNSGSAQWLSDTASVTSLAKNTDGLGIWVESRINTAGTLTLSGLHIWVQEQGNIA